MSFTPNQIANYARVLIWGLHQARAGKFKPYDKILVRYEQAALPLAEEIHKELIRQKQNVILRAITYSGIEKNFYLYSDQKQRQFLTPGDRELYSELNGNILLSAPDSLTHLKTIDPKKIGEVMVTRKALREIMEKREEQGHFGWTLCTYTTEALAKQARMSVQEYTNQIVKACYLNEKDPVRKWQEIFKEALEIKQWLNNLKIRDIYIQSAGTDLKITLGERRKFMGISGHNIPSFEIFTSPDWRGTEGVYLANQPSYRSGNYVSGVKLKFTKGRAKVVSADEGENFVRKTLALDKQACQIGEFSLTDTRFSKIDRFMADTLFDENYGGKHGNCHIAVGSAYSDTFAGDPAKLTRSLKQRLGFNDSALHWDLVNTEDKVVTVKLANGKQVVLYEQGQFKL